MEIALSSGVNLWPSGLAIVIAVFTPLVIWCIVAFRLRQITWRSMLALAGAELVALAAVAVLAHF